MDGRDRRGSGRTVAVDLPDTYTTLQPHVVIAFLSLVARRGQRAREKRKATGADIANPRSSSLYNSKQTGGTGDKRRFTGLGTCRGCCTRRNGRESVSDPGPRLRRWFLVSSPERERGHGALEHAKSNRLTQPTARINLRSATALALGGSHSLPLRTHLLPPVVVVPPSGGGLVVSDSESEGTCSWIVCSSAVAPSEAEDAGRRASG